MADDLKLKIQLEATSDKKQVESEAKEVAKTANDALKVEKMRLQLDKAGLEKELKNLLTEISKAKVKGDKDLEFYATLEAKSVTNQISTIDKQITDLDKKITGGTADVSGGFLGKLKNFVAKGALIAGVTKIGKSILELGMSAEQARISFTTMLGDAEQAEAMLSKLSEFAKNSTFDLQGVRESAKQLLAMGISAQDMIPTLKALGDVSAGLSVPMERLALNYGQVITQGKLTGKELKDFTTAGVPLLDELAKNLGKTKTEIQDMVSAGQIGAQDMVEAFRTMTEEGGRFANLNEAQSKTLQGQWNNFMETLAGIGEQIGLAVIPALTDMMQSTANATEDLNNMGDSGLTASEAIAWGIQIVIDGIRGLVKVLQSFGTFFGTLFSSIWTLASGVFKDLQTVTVNLATNSKEIFSAMGENIKTGILKGVQSAINGINKLLEWANDKIGLDFGKIGPITTGEYKTIFGDDIFKNTKNAIEGINLAWDDAMNDVGESWSNFAEKVTKEQENIKKTFRGTAKDITNSNKGALQEMINDISGGGSGGGGGGGKKSVKGAYEELGKEMKSLYNDMDSSVNEHQKKLDTAKNNIKKVEDQHEKLKNKAKDTWESAEKSIKSYNEQLEKNQTDSIEKLGQRYVELKEKRAEIDNDYLKRRIGDISSSEWSNIRDEGWTWHGFTYNDLKDIKELYDEIKLIEENTTEEQRKSQEFTEKTSKAQEILNDMNEKAVELEQQKAQALEKQAIAQAMMNQEEGKRYIQTINKNGEEKTFYYDTVKKQWERILDEDNIQYAKQLEQQTTELNNQLEQYKSEKDEEVEILIDINARKTQLEKEYTTLFQTEIAKQKKSVEDLISYYDRLIAKKNEYYSSSTISKRAYGGEIASAKVSLVGENGPEHIIARQSSYVQPRNASNSYSTVNSNNTSNLTINGMEIGTYNSTDEMLEDLKQRLTYRS